MSDPIFTQNGNPILIGYKGWGREPVYVTLPKSFLPEEPTVIGVLQSDVPVLEKIIIK